MAAILSSPLSKAGRKFHSVRIDMTPMVDLGFLLITFFIFTTSMMEPNVTKLIMPTDGPGTPVSPNKIITALVDNNKLLLYEGSFDEASAGNKLVKTDFNVKTGFGHFIRQKQRALDAKGQKEDLVIAIKPLTSASYGDVMNALDEMKINNVQRYAIVDISQEEKNYAIKHQ